MDASLRQAIFKQCMVILEQRVKQNMLRHAFKIPITRYIFTPTFIEDVIQNMYLQPSVFRPFGTYL